MEIVVKPAYPNGRPVINPVMGTPFPEEGEATLRTPEIDVLLDQGILVEVASPAAKKK